MYLQITVALVAVVLFLLYKWRKEQFTVFRKSGIPGPEPNLLFGNYLEIFLKDPIQCHEKWFKKYGKVYGYFNGTRPVLVVTDTNLLRNVQIKDFHKFSDRPLMFNEGKQPKSRRNLHLISLRGKKWKEIRSLVTPSFTTSKMKQMSPIMNEAIDHLIENFEEKCKSGETFDAYELYRRLTMDVIGRTAFGIQTNVQRNPKDPFLRLSQLLFHVPFRFFTQLMMSSFPIMRRLVRFFSNCIVLVVNKGTNPLEELFNRCEAVIKARTDDPTKKRVDLLQLMIDAELPEDSTMEDKSLAAGEEEEQEISAKSNGKGNSVGDKKNTRHLTIDEMVSNAFVFLLAGFETTSTALSFVTMMLVNHLEVQEKIRQEVNDLIEKEGQLNYFSVHKLQYLDQVLSEVLRLYPPITLFVNREAAEDVEYDNIQIPKGMAIQTSTFILHRDPDYWPEPTKFMPERFSPENRSRNDPLAWQPFGSGPRNCVGMRFAQMEAKLTLARLLHKYYLLPSEKTDKYPFQLDVSPNIIRPKYGVPIKIKACQTRS